MRYPLVRNLATTGVPVAVAYLVLNCYKQGFYQLCANPVSARKWYETHLINVAYDLHADDPEFGY